MIFSEYHQRAVNLLAEAYAKDFAEYVENTGSYVELIHQLAAEYINRNIPIVDEEAEYELGYALTSRVTLNGKERESM